MSWILRNIGTVSLLAFATAAFLTEVAGVLPEEAGAHVTSAALIALGVGRGLMAFGEAFRQPRVMVEYTDPQDAPTSTGSDPERVG